MLDRIYGSRLLTIISLVIFLGIAEEILYLHYRGQLHIETIPFIWMALFGGLGFIFTYMSFENFVSGYLLGLFTMMVSWRIAILCHIPWVPTGFLIIFACYVCNFIFCVYQNLTHPMGYRLPLCEWQAIFIRIYIGLNFIPHFTEKLFAGIEPHTKIVGAFVALGVPDPNTFVWIAGVCELGAAVTLSLGLMMRVGALGSLVYLMIAAYLGHHFSLGFTWASPGGGWEFTVMWSIFILTYVITGPHRFSLDQDLIERYSLPGWLQKVM